MSEGAPFSSLASAGVESPAHARNRGADEIGTIFITAGLDHRGFTSLDFAEVSLDLYLKRTQVETWLAGGETKTTVAIANHDTGAVVETVTYNPSQAAFEAAVTFQDSNVYTLISRTEELTTFYFGGPTTPALATTSVILSEINTWESTCAACRAMLYTPDIDSYDSHTFITVFKDGDGPVITEISPFPLIIEPNGIAGQSYFRFTTHHVEMRRSKTVLPVDRGIKTITYADNATPIVIVSALHGFDEGDRVLIEGVVGNEDANGDWNIENVTDNTFALIDSAGSGGYVSGGTAIDLNYRICIVTVKSPDEFGTGGTTVKCIPFKILREEDSIYLEPACTRGQDQWQTNLYRGSNHTDPADPSDYPTSCLDEETTGADPDCSLS